MPASARSSYCYQALPRNEMAQKVAMFLHEAIEKRKYVFIILLFVGIYILTVGMHALQLTQGDLFIAIAAMTLGGTNVLSKFAMREMSGELVASLRMIVGAILLLGLVLLKLLHVLTALDGRTCWVVVSTIGSVLFLNEALVVQDIVGGALILWSLYRLVGR
jgi:drug/metabolite transporter (DMT)-like permease